MGSSEHPSPRFRFPLGLGSLSLPMEGLAVGCISVKVGRWCLPHGQMVLGSNPQNLCSSVTCSRMLPNPYYLLLNRHFIIYQAPVSKTTGNGVSYTCYEGAGRGSGTLPRDAYR